MAKRYTRDELNKKIMHILMVSFETIQACSKELTELNIAPEEWELDEPSDRIKKARDLMARMHTVNMTIAPCFGIARQMFPGGHKLVDMCESNYNRAIKEKIFNEKCPCPGCYDQD